MGHSRATSVPSQIEMLLDYTAASLHMNEETLTVKEVLNLH